MASLTIELGGPSYRPRATLPLPKLDSSGIGNGHSALLRLESKAGQGDEVLPPTWLCVPIWQRTQGEDHVVATRISNASRKRQTSLPPDEVAGLSGDLLLASNLVPYLDDASQVTATLHPVPASRTEAETLSIVIDAVSSVASNESKPKLSPRTVHEEPMRSLLEILAKELLIEIGTVVHNQTFAAIQQGCNIVFRVQSSKFKANAPLLQEAMAACIHVSRGTNVKLVSPSVVKSSKSPNEAPAPPISEPISSQMALGGLDQEIKQLRELVFLPLVRQDLFEQHGLKPPRGVLLHGPPGTGKTSLSLAVASSFLQPSQIFTISGPELSSSLHGRTEGRIRKVFQQARKQQRAVIIIDEIDVIAASRGNAEGDSVGSRVVATLLTEIDGVGQEYKRKKSRTGDTHTSMHAPGRVVVIAATNRPNALDPALRRPGRLDREIEIGVPNPAARRDIIDRLLRFTPHSLSEDDLQQVASRTHGFVGADLNALVREAGMRVIRRQMQAEASGADGIVEATQRLSLEKTGIHKLTAEDLFAALPLMRPSSLRSLMPPPPLSWASIGLGSPDSPYAQIKQAIQQTVEWPLRYQDRMRKLGITANRGVLLYGPPGCSKTMIARACAQSEGINWIGVKGPELYSKYLGDSEKAIRELFHKARTAAPTIIFFDEIDALTTTRSAGGEDGGANAVSDRVIATLLTELDGAEALEKVVIVAATNRPQVIDPALLRPGRLDTLLYVGPPDHSARRSIFELRSKAMAVDSSLDLEKLATMTDGCSGAEIVSICQDAGIRAMKEDVQATCVSQAHFEAAAKAMRKRITPEMLRQYESWREQRTT